MLIRLDKFLADLGIGTRKEVKKIIRSSKLVTVNDVFITNDDYKVDTLKDIVKLDGEVLTLEEFYYYMLNKPQGYVSATTDNYLPTVIDLIDAPSRINLFPVGRLDIDSTGLLIITNDGALAHKSLSPKHHVEKDYLITYKGILVSDVCERFANGIDIGDETLTKPAKIRLLENNSALVTLTEGRFHQVKRMILACNGEVTSLKRIRFGNLVLDESLKEGEYRLLSADEIDTIFN